MENKKNYIGFNSSQIAYLVADLVSKENQNNLLLIAPDNKQALDIHNSLETFLGQSKWKLNFLEPWDFKRFEGLSPYIKSSANRLRVLRNLEKNFQILILTPKALIEKYPNNTLLDQSVFKLIKDQKISIDELLQKLLLLGYRERSIIEKVGDFSPRGQVVDIYLPSDYSSIRLEFFMNQILSIRKFSLESQRSFEELNKVKIEGVSETYFGEKINQNAIYNIKDRADDLEINYRDLDYCFQALKNNMPWPGLEELSPIIHENYVPVWELVKPGYKVLVVDSTSVERNIDEELDSHIDIKTKAETSYKLTPKLGGSHISPLKLKEEITKKAIVNFNFSSLETSKINEITNKKDINLSSHSKLGIDLKAYYLSLKNSESSPISPIKKYFNDLSEYSILICCSNKLIRNKLSRVLKDINITFNDFNSSINKFKENKPIGVFLHGSYLDKGLIDHNQKIAFFSDTDILPNTISYKPTKRKQSSKNYIRSTELLELNDFIVHEDYGIGIYRGIKEVKINNKLGDFIILEFEGGDNLLIPAQNLTKLQKYEGLTDKDPKLNKLGANTWQSERKNVKKSALELAGKLISLYAQRSMEEGTAFLTGPESDEFFASQFPFEETPDQLKAIQEVLADMESSKPMDRLVCGDVGYGKTEVAMRAAYKSTTFGKQVAIVVPTTILADQHYSSFLDRFIDTDVKIGCVSRFYSTRENKETIEKLKNGKLDIIIGTHRLLSKDIEFKDLGLLIIDEEHRFGVAHKEKLKEIKKGVDVLTLTATPIPRTLHMSLLSIRELSTIETPPQNRLPIRTYLSEDNQTVIKEAIKNELQRGGQVYFVHNKVKNIEAVTNELRDLVPDAKIEFAHGQMKPKELDNIMHSFILGEIDILISTTIIESGLDIPNANTIIIKDADKFGLAALYQLRGRVGRSSKRGYAYLFISKTRKLSTEAEKRLNVLRSIDDLGVGYRLALQDLQIRGAGNLLGKDQSGSVSKVGFDMYTKILKQAIELQKNGVDNSNADFSNLNPEIKIGFPAHIPSDYIACLSQRMLLYSRLSSMSTEDNPLDIIDEIEDRYGRAPDDIISLVELMSLRALIQSYGISVLTLKGKELSLSLSPKMEINPERVIELIQTSKGKYKITSSGVIKIDTSSYELNSPKDFSRAVRNIMDKLSNN